VVFEYVIQEDLRWNGKLVKQPNKFDMIVFHHLDAEGVSIQELHAYERDVKGWKGTGYHFYIRENGKPYWGRPLGYVGGAVKDSLKKDGIPVNQRAVHVCVEGKRHLKKMPDDQKAMLFRIVRDLYKDSPDAVAYGHGELDNTACPGKYFPLAECKALKNEPFQETKQKPAPQPKPVAFTLSRLLKKKLILMRGADVLAVQKALKAAGFNPGAVDGIFGKQTQAAVIAFQKAKKLTPDGIVGKRTCTALGGKWTGK
jgi:N-acetyl-anhydromuramyl-L-alanine amidase AmpD